MGSFRKRRIEPVDPSVVSLSPESPLMVKVLVFIIWYPILYTIIKPIHFLWNKIIPTLHPVLNFIENFLTHFWSDYIEHALSTFIETIVNPMIRALGDIINWIKNLGIPNFLQRIQRNISSTIRSVIDFFKSIWNSTIGSICRTLWTKFVSILNFIRQRLATPLSDCYDFCSKHLIQPALKHVKNLLKEMMNLCKQYLIQPMLNTIRKVIKTLYNFCTQQILQPIVKSIETFFQKSYNSFIIPFRGIKQGCELITSVCWEWFLHLVWNPILNPIWNMYKEWTKKGVEVDGYILGISPGKLIEKKGKHHPDAGDLNGIVVLKHQQVYSVYLKNGHPVRCNCRLSIDGKQVGQYQLQPYSEYYIERPLDEAKRFTFFVESNSTAAANTGIIVGNSENGLVEAQFLPEKLAFSSSKHKRRSRRGNAEAQRASQIQADEEIYDEPDDDILEAELAGHETGATTLTEDSDQQFQSAYKLQVDEEKIVAIQLKLVGPLRSS
jgi:hypothetical protein